MARKLKIKTDGVVIKGSIPDNIEELELECDEIANTSFFKNKSLRILKLINVEKINTSAFHNCKKLISLEIVNCKEISPNLFKKNKSLLDLTLNNVEKIDDRAFSDCKILSAVKLLNCGEMGNGVFADCKQLSRASLDCKVIGDRSFFECYNLNDLTLLNTEVIGEYAFSRCKLNGKIALPDTLREIKNNAFADSLIEHLVIPPSVTKLGSHIASYSRYREDPAVLEIYLKDDGIAPFFDGNPHYALKTKLVVRSLETGKILYQFVVFNCFETVLTEHGVDFTEYDKLFFDPSVTNIEAARTRIHHPIGLSKETSEHLKDYLSEAVSEQLKSLLCERSFNFDDFKEHLNELKVKAIIELIPDFETAKLPEVTEALMKHLYKKINDIDSFDKVSDSELMEITEYSARQGMTELTALLMQKLHERKIRKQDDTL